MKQRLLLIAACLLVVLLLGVTTIFFSSWFTTWQNANAYHATLTATASVPTPTPTPTPPPTPTPTPLVNGSSAYLVDATSGRVLLDTNSHLRVSMWSTTKIMTALLAIENLSMDQTVTVQQEELDEVPGNMSVAILKVGDQLSIRDLLYALILPSGSDAAVVLAHAVSGDTASFVALMNTRAAQLGLNDTHYANPNGAADAGHYSSAADLVKLATVAMAQPMFAQIVSTPSYHIDANLSHTVYTWQNVINPFLLSYPGANGIKTGSNADSTDWSMVFSATRNGRLLIGAEMQAHSEHQVFADAGNILDKGFASE